MLLSFVRFALIQAQMLQTLGLRKKITKFLAIVRPITTSVKQQATADGSLGLTPQIGRDRLLVMDALACALGWHIDRR